MALRWFLRIILVQHITLKEPRPDDCRLNKRAQVGLVMLWFYFMMISEVYGCLYQVYGGLSNVYECLSKVYGCLSRVYG